jgi:hypothetical protein
MDLKEVPVVLKKCGMLILGAIGVATMDVPKFNYTSSKFSKTLVLVGPSMVASSISLDSPSTLT